VAPGLESCHALVLNADFRPLSYFPLSVWSWQDAVKAVFLDRVSVVSQYDRTIHSPTFEMRLPSVIALKEYVPAARRPAFTRFNVFLRDRFICQYCNGDFATSELTFDHVVPKSRGGRTSWQNVVTACSPCNLRKGNLLLKESGPRPAPRTGRAFHADAAGAWTRVPAGLPARELARFSCIGTANSTKA
jgi:5-methylcytosine-specific restriction endonuclease McrA